MSAPAARLAELEAALARRGVLAEGWGPLPEGWQPPPVPGPRRRPGPVPAAREAAAAQNARRAAAAAAREAVAFAALLQARGGELRPRHRLVAEARIANPAMTWPELADLLGVTKSQAYGYCKRLAAKAAQALAADRGAPAEAGDAA